MCVRALTRISYILCTTRTNICRICGCFACTCASRGCRSRCTPVGLFGSGTKHASRLTYSTNSYNSTPPLNKAASSGWSIFIQPPSSSGEMADSNCARSGGSGGGHYLANSPNAALDKTILTKYIDLPVPGKIQATYVWIDGSGENVRCKDRTVEFIPSEASELPVWNFDGSSTNQAVGHNSDVFLYPRAMYKDPFRRGNNILVMCETFDSNYEPTKSNNRKGCDEAFQQCKDEEPWFGIEQEYTLLDSDMRPFGWPPGGCPPPQGPYYCGVGANKVYARDLIEAHYRCCLYAGISIYGSNAEVMPSQWEFQIGPAVGTRVADDLWMARFILHRLAEEFGIIVSLDPKPVEGWNGSGAHTNFSTTKMRDENGIIEIERAIDKLSKVHMRHIKVYDPRGGKDNEKRLTGKFETSSINDFSAGVANRQCSIRIPRSVAEDKKGYLEDRRPSSNCDPYAVVEALLRTVCLNE